MNSMCTSALAAVVMTALACNSAGAAEVVYFGVTNGGPDQSFVIALNNSTQIAQARAIIADPQGQKGVVHVWGTVVTSPVKYNKPGPNADPWPFHLDPTSIRFFYVGPKLCDAPTTAVSRAVSAGTLKSLLPAGSWCPWASQVVAELKPADMKSGASASPQDHGLPWPWGKKAGQH